MARKTRVRFPPSALKKALTKLKLFSKYCDIWKIISQNEIVGFIIINPNQWCPGNIIFGEEMAIKSEFQNRKIATKAIKKIFSYYKTKGYKTFMGIINKNSKSFGLFKKAGLNQSSESVLMEGDIK